MRSLLLRRCQTLKIKNVHKDEIPPNDLSLKGFDLSVKLSFCTYRGFRTNHALLLPVKVSEGRVQQS
jgi:hypothetical protein